MEVIIVREINESHCLAIAPTRNNTAEINDVQTWTEFRQH